MTKLEELINELCPDGVEYFTLEELGIFYGGLTGKSKKDFEKGNAKFITYMNVYSNPALKLDVSDVVTIGENERQNCIQYADILFTGSSETPNDCGMSSVLTEYTDEKLYLNSFSFGYRFNNPDKFDVIYLKHLFRSHMLRKQIVKTANGVTRFNVSKAKMAKVKIPVPPKEIQCKIGRILDNFTELTAELTARKKQYAFYRDYLLDFSNEDVTKKIPDIDCSNVEYKRLGNIAIIERGKRVVRNDLSQEIGYPVYQNALKPLGYYTDKNRNANSVFVIGAGAAGEIGYSYVDYWAADDCFTFVCDDKLNQRYLYFLLMSKQAYLKNNVRKSSIPRLPRIALENMEIPVPPLSVQENIVKILDRFDKLNNDMSEGLPAEIEARKKQYEYYRDTLLSFDDKACSHIVKVERERELTRIKAIKWLSIQDLFNLRNGYTPSKSKSEYWTNGTIPWFRMEDIRENGHILNDSIQHITPIAVKGNLFPANSIILATSATIGEHALITVDSLANQRFTYLNVKNEYSNQLNMKYVFYYFFKIDEWCKNNLNVSSFASVDMDKFKKLKFPIPPLEEQERIVSILDRFDKLCNDISEGLPAEIEARQKQYEYYRDKLLSFKEKNHA